MYYIVYKTTNLINNKIYIGIHKQPMLEFDGYLGSGLLLTRAIKKSGKENFIRETLFTFPTLDESRLKEKELVDEDFCNRVDTYNISIGGTGGDTMAGHSIERKQEANDKRKLTCEQNGSHIYEGDKLLRAQERMKNVRIQPDNKGKTHTEVQNKTQSEYMKNTRWITKDDENRKIGKNEEIPEGWNLGRYVPEEQKFKGHTVDILKQISDKRQDKIYITDGTVNILVDSFSIIPEGWCRGLTRHKKDKLMFITDGVISRKIGINETVPTGWQKGRTFNKRNKNG